MVEASSTHQEGFRNHTDVHTAVRDAYASRVTGENKGGSCCKTKKTSCCSSLVPSETTKRSAEKMGYTKEDLESVPDESNLGLGCGAPLRAAAVSKGETVLDLGSGAGFDAFLAAKLVGPEGHVIGVDMTEEMVEKAKEHAARRQSGGGPTVEFRHGMIEDLPVEDNSIDVIISNCVINLSPDKPAVFREAFRVLKPGGRIAVSDIVLTKPLPAVIRERLSAYVGCIAGASLIQDYVGAMSAAGFSGIETTTKHAFDVLAADDPVVQDMLKTEPVGDVVDDLEDIKRTIVSVTVVATRPAALHD